MQDCNVRPPQGFADYWNTHSPGDDLAQIVSFLRDEDTVMAPSELSEVLAASTSFSDTLVARCLGRGWHVNQVHNSVDRDAVGDLAYEIRAEGHLLHFSVRSQAAGIGEERQGRLRENAFDLYGTLIQGPASLDEMSAQHDEQITKAWKGRASGQTLGWSFANRSQGLFEGVIAALAAGTQPSEDPFLGGGAYLVRNAGFYGNGRHGTQAWLTLSDDHPLAHPYHLDLFTLLMWKIASIDLVQLAASQRSREAVELQSRLRTAVGVGNSSGIGTVATQVRWPTTLATITFLREFALARSLWRIGLGGRAEVCELVDALRADQSGSVNDSQADVISRLEALNDVHGGSAPDGLSYEVSTLLRNLDAKARAILIRALIDKYPDTVNMLKEFAARTMKLIADVDPAMRLNELEEILRVSYVWVDALEAIGDVDRTHFWYRSAENGENRRGERYLDPGTGFETFVDVADAIRRLAFAIGERPSTETVGRFLLDHPEHSAVVGRVQLTQLMPYSEIRCNLVSKAFLPSDLIHYFLSCLGMTHTMPVSNLWVRGVFFAGDSLDGVLNSKVLGYPELRRVLPDALRARGVPATMTFEVSEMLTWSQACIPSTLGSWHVDEPLYEAGRSPSFDDRSFDLEGLSLLVWGARVCDVILAEFSQERELEVELVNVTSGRHVLPYMADRLARALGAPVEVSSREVIGNADRWVVDIRSEPIDHSVRTLAADEFLRRCSSGNKADPCLGEFRIRAFPKEHPQVLGRSMIDLTKLREAGFVGGISTSMRDYTQVIQSVESLRVPASERSSVQAG